MCLRASSRIRWWGNWGITIGSASGARIRGISIGGGIDGASLAGRTSTEVAGTSNTACSTPGLGAFMKGCSSPAPDGASWNWKKGMSPRQKGMPLS
ncbi:conserved hypothetical protein [Ricinus communis]|uniref:Uncharacterized protein n=1 Tax=Ricinus communis TaxID=3988 RepID=B9SIS3_RICCO|nr:conserved hypothetical protein [Ricinus communis]